MRYRAVLAASHTMDDLIAEVEICGGSDFQVDSESASVVFSADADDIPAIEALATVEKLIELRPSREGASDRAQTSP